MKSLSHHIQPNTQIVQSHRAGTFLGGIEQNHLTEEQVAHYYAILRLADEKAAGMNREVEMLAEDANGNLIPLRDQQGNILYEHDSNGNVAVDFNGNPIPQYMKIKEEINNEFYYVGRRNSVQQGYKAYSQKKITAGFADMNSGPRYEINTYPSNWAKDIEAIHISSNDVIIFFNRSVNTNHIQSYCSQINAIYYRADKYDREPTGINVQFSHVDGIKGIFNR